MTDAAPPLFPLLYVNTDTTVYEVQGLQPDRCHGYTIPYLFIHTRTHTHTHTHTHTTAALNAIYSARHTRHKRCYSYFQLSSTQPQTFAFLERCSAEAPWGRGTTAAEGQTDGWTDGPSPRARDKRQEIQRNNIQTITTSPCSIQS